MKWRCKDGLELDVEEMESAHIQNCINMLRRNGYVSLDTFWRAVGSASASQGEMASYYAEQEIADMMPTAILDEMEFELGRRRQANLTVRKEH